MATKQKSNTSNQFSRAAKKQLKKMPTAVKAVLAVCLVAGVAAGIFACKMISKNDGFELKGQKNFTVEVGTGFTYTEEGIDAICFGQDVSGKASVSTTLEKDANGNYVIPTDEEGVYTITYTVDALKFNGKLSKEQIKRVRTFTVVEIEEDGRYE